MIKKILYGLFFVFILLIGYVIFSHDSTYEDAMVGKYTFCDYLPIDSNKSSLLPLLELQKNLRFSYKCGGRELKGAWEAGYNIEGEYIKLIFYDNSGNQLSYATGEIGGDSFQYIRIDGIPHELDCGNFKFINAIQFKRINRFPN